MNSILEDGDTVLRAAEEADMAFLHELRNDLELQMMLMVQPRPNSIQRVREWVARVSGDERSVFFVIASKHQALPVGFVQLVQMDMHHGTAELGICLGAQARGKGHGAAAMKMLEQFAQDVFGIRKLVLRVLARNEGALRFYFSLGFEQVGVHRDHFRQAGAFHDVVLMEKFLGSAPR